MSRLEDCLLELQEAEKETTPKRRGFTQLTHTEQKPETLEKAKAAESDYRGRVTYLQAAITALENLKKNGYPNLFDYAFSAEVFSDLQQDQTDINAAMSHVHEEGEVMGGHIEFQKLNNQ